MEVTGIMKKPEAITQVSQHALIYQILHLMPTFPFHLVLLALVLFHSASTSHDKNRKGMKRNETTL